jgi:hypothetical protein
VENYVSRPYNSYLAIFPLQGGNKINEICGVLWQNKKKIPSENLVIILNSLIKPQQRRFMQRLLTEAMKKQAKNVVTKNFKKPIRNKMPPFDYGKDFKAINFRKNPEQYQVGKGTSSNLSHDGSPDQIYSQ